MSRLANILRDVQPVNSFRAADNEKFEKILNHIWGMTKPPLARMINQAASLVRPDEIYLEVGCFRGGSLVCALQDNKTRAIGVENFSEFEAKDNNAEALIRHMEEFQLTDRVSLVFKSFYDFFQEPGQTIPPVGTYFYDANHSTQGTIDGVRLALPYLADDAIIVLDDFNMPEVRKAIYVLLEAYPQNLDLFYAYQTVAIGDPNWWFGFALLSYSKS